MVISLSCHVSRSSLVEFIFRYFTLELTIDFDRDLALNQNAGKTAHRVAPLQSILSNYTNVAFANSALAQIQSPNCQAQNSDSTRYGAVINFSKFCHSLWRLAPRYTGSHVKYVSCQYRTSIPDWWFVSTGRRRRDVPLVLFSIRIYAPASGNISNIEIKSRKILIIWPFAVSLLHLDNTIREKCKTMQLKFLDLVRSFFNKKIMQYLLYI